MLRRTRWMIFLEITSFPSLAVFPLSLYIDACEDPSRRHFWPHTCMLSSGALPQIPLGDRIALGSLLVPAAVFRNFLKSSPDCIYCICLNHRKLQIEMTSFPVDNAMKFKRSDFHLRSYLNHFFHFKFWWVRRWPTNWSLKVHGPHNSDALVLWSEILSDFCFLFLVLIFKISCITWFIFLFHYFT